MVVDHQVAQRPLDEVAEPPPRRVGAVEAPLEESEGELLAELGGGVRAAQGGQQVAVDGPGVAVHQLGLGSQGPARTRPDGPGRPSPTRSKSGSVAGPVLLAP